MLVNGIPYKAIWIDKNTKSVKIINQQKLPFEFEIVSITNYKELILAIKDMRLRGAPLIGVAGAYALWLACVESVKKSNKNKFIDSAYLEIISARPTASNLQFATSIVYNNIKKANYKNCETVSLNSVNKFYDNEINSFKKIGEHGYTLLKHIAQKKKNGTINILTHCNAGWLACGDYGTATAPIYYAHKIGIKIHVWVDETRPRFQGAKLTAWELFNEKIPFTVIADNTGGHLMQNKLVDIVITGADRIATNGDTANKIGTYLKALAAFDNKIPFYIAAPTSTIDFNLTKGVNNIVIEKRNSNELIEIEGINNKEKNINVKIMPKNYNAENYAFDVTPNRLISGIITEKGICKANTSNIVKLK